SYPTSLPSSWRLSFRRSWIRLLMDFSSTLSGITIGSRPPWDEGRGFLKPLRATRSLVASIADDEGFTVGAAIAACGVPRGAAACAPDARARPRVARRGGRGDPDPALPRGRPHPRPADRRGRVGGRRRDPRPRRPAPVDAHVEAV